MTKKISAALAALLAAAPLCLLCAGPAKATDPSACSPAYTAGWGGYYKVTDHSGPYYVDGSCTATAIGNLGGGTVTQGTAASAGGAWPTYLTQGGSALSTSNGIFVNPTTGATFQVSGSVSISGTPTVNVGTFPALTGQSGSGVDVGAVEVMPDAAPASINITAADAASSSASGANSQSIITGSPTANSAAVFALTNSQTVNVQVSGTWVGTLATEVSIDGGTTWYTQGLHQIGTTVYSSSFTGNFAGSLSTAGRSQFRVRATAWTSGTAVVKVRTSANVNSVYVAGQNPAFPTNITSTDCSGSITTGGTAQTLIPASTTIHGFTVQWRATAEPGWVSFTGTAAANSAGSYYLTAPAATTYVGGGSFTTPPGFGTNHAVSIFGATTGDLFSCTYW